MITGRLKVFRSLAGWRSEFLQYRRRNVETKLGEHTQVVKKKDHRMDGTRYLTVSGIRIMKTRPISTEKKKPMGGLLGGFPAQGGSSFGWMGN